MTVRFLPKDEWGKLAGTPWAGLPAGSAELLVVEDGAGVVVGTWSLVVLPHLEGFWVHPDHQGKAAVAKALLTTMFAKLTEVGVDHVLTHAPADHVAAFLTRLGGTSIPGQAFTLPIPVR